LRTARVATVTAFETQDAAIIRIAPDWN